MTQAYSDPNRETDPHALPDIEVFQLTAEEAVGLLDDAIIDNEGITGGWFYWYCFPGCMPDSEPYGPFDSYALALKDAQDRPLHYSC